MEIDTSRSLEPRFARIAEKELKRPVTEYYELALAYPYQTPDTLKIYGTAEEFRHFDLESLLNAGYKVKSKKLLWAI